MYGLDVPIKFKIYFKMKTISKESVQWLDILSKTYIIDINVLDLVQNVFCYYFVPPIKYQSDRFSVLSLIKYHWDSIFSIV